MLIQFESSITFSLRRSTFLVDFYSSFVYSKCIIGVNCGLSSRYHQRELDCKNRSDRSPHTRCAQTEAADNKIIVPILSCHPYQALADSGEILHTKSFTLQNVSWEHEEGTNCSTHVDDIAGCQSPQRAHKPLITCRYRANYQ